MFCLDQEVTTDWFAACHDVWLVQEFLPIGRMNELETANMAALMKELSGSIKKGVEFANEGQRLAPLAMSRAGQYCCVIQHLHMSCVEFCTVLCARHCHS